MIEAHSKAIHALLHSPTIYEHLYLTPIHEKREACLVSANTINVGRLVVVIDVNPSHWFWTARLMRYLDMKDNVHAETKPMDG